MEGDPGHFLFGNMSLLSSLFLQRGGNRVCRKTVCRNVTNHGNFKAVYNNIASPNYERFVGFLYRHEGTVIDFVD